MRCVTLCACLLIAMGCGQKEDAGKDEAKKAPAKVAEEKSPAATPAPTPMPEPEPELSEAQKIAAIAAQIPELAGPYMTILEVRTEERALHEQHKDDPDALVAAIEAWAPTATARLKPACIAKENMVKPDGHSPEANKLAMVMLHLGGETLDFSDKDNAIRNQWDKETKSKIFAALDGTSCLDLVDQE